MIKNIWTVLASNIITDKETNMVSYVNCIEIVITKGLPAKMPTIGIGTLWEKETDQDNSLMVKITLISPSGKIKDVFKTDSIPLPVRRHRLNIIAGNLVAEEEGEYKIRVEVMGLDKWIIANEVPFVVTVRK
ncbi:MAG: hypothetical protein PHH68_01030 [Candidatus Omnitrophica bacterium]|jgi:hypothetical protein|nr:hypothetical protein [Candidatus Omnitrophota bacterium]MDD5078893.1 hypothetical protein [Candidatus Omnitrophota bacterium]